MGAISPTRRLEVSGQRPVRSGPSLAASLVLFGAYDLIFPAALNGPQFLDASPLKNPFTVQDGVLAVPDGPSLGVEVDEAKRQKLLVTDPMKPPPVNRLKTLLLAASLALAGPACAAPNPFFVFDNGLRGEGLTTIAAQLDLARDIGFDGISWRTDAPARVREVLEGTPRRGLKLFVLYAHLVLRDGELVVEPRLREIIALCRGSDAIIWPTITSKQFKNSDPAGDEIAVNGLRELARLCDAHGLRLALYPHVNTWLHRVEDALRVVRKVDRPNVGLTFNLCHALMDGAEARISDLITSAAPHLFVVTLNGADRNAAPGRFIQPLDQGTYDVGPVLRQLREVGFTGPVGLQCFNLKGDPRSVLAGSMKAWRTLAAVPPSPPATKTLP
jgi:sugar phosphate isomerase/epimerase